MAVLRFLRFRDFERQVHAFDPDIIFYNVEASPLRRPPLAMRLFFYNEGDVCVFLDFVSTGRLHLGKLSFTSMITRRKPST